MKKLIPVIVLVVVVVAIVVAKKQGGPAAEVEPVVWYGMMPHPYISEVQSGAAAAEDAVGTKVLKVVGQEWTQDNENANIKALSTKGHKCFSVFPGDPAGANGLFAQLVRNGQQVVAYGAEPNLPTPASFTVATHIHQAATDACEKLVKMMGGKGNILNVLETVTDVNTKVRDDAIIAVAAKYPEVNIIQTISDMTQVSVAKEKIQSALAARGEEIDGIITTGYNPTIAAAAVLSEWHAKPDHKRIRYIGIDTGDTVLEAIRNGSIDATVSQNPFGHGYISCTILAKMAAGWTPKEEYQFIDAGHVIVTKENLDTYAAEVKAITDAIIADIETKYLRPPE
jgi:ribose transport system substrate-binding protein